MKKIRSRIHEFIDEDLMNQLDKICNNVIVSDNNIKAATIKQTLDDHGIYYNELGPGTNRMAVLIDGYVFKIAMDKWGKQDNANEFAMSKELQPFVIKVYESNDLISVSEYVTLISREEFIEKKNEILKILSILSESYLLGDVGYITKNFTNWGYRDDGSLVILDFAYIHTIHGEELFCPNDRTMLEYDVNFYNLRCPKCGLVRSFSDIRKKISMEDEWAIINEVKNHSYQLTSSSITIKEDGEQNNKINKKEEVKMPENQFTEEIIETSYKSALDKLRNGLLEGSIEPEVTEYYEEPEDTFVNTDDDEEENDFGSAVELMRRVNNVIVPVEVYNEEEPEEDEDEVEEEEPEIVVGVFRATKEADDVKVEAVVLEQSEQTEELQEMLDYPVEESNDVDVLETVEPKEEEGVYEVVEAGEVDVLEEASQKEDEKYEVEHIEETTNYEDFDFHAIADSITDEDMAQGEVIPRSTPSSTVSILTGDSEVDVVVPKGETEVTITVNNLSEETNEETEMVIGLDISNDNKTEVIEIEGVEVVETTAPKNDLMAQAYEQRMNNFRSSIRITRPEEEVGEEDEMAKYERLARESGYEVD